MGYTGLTWLRFGGAALLPVLLTAAIYPLGGKSWYRKLPRPARQLFVGLCFGAVAVFATEYGTAVEGAVLNVRNAAPLTAGLLFGWPAGMIAGVIGGVGRWFSESGDFTRLACTLGTVVAGVLGGAVRKYMVENKNVSWFYGLAVGIISEVIHMLLIFVTNADNIPRGMNVVQAVAVPMIVANGLSVMLASLAVSYFGKRNNQNSFGRKNIAQAFQRWLLVSVVLAFVVTMLFTQVLQNRIAMTTVDYTLSTNIQDVCTDIQETSDANLLRVTRTLAEGIEGDPGTGSLIQKAAIYGVSEINLVDENGIVYQSTNGRFIGYNMADGEQSAEFLRLLEGEKEYVQAYRTASVNDSLHRKYAGVALPQGGFVQVGYDARRFQQEITQQVVNGAKNRHIGQDGFIIICDENGVVVSDREGREGETMIHLQNDVSDVKKFERFAADIYGEPSYCMYTETEGYYIIGVMSEKEAFFARDTAVFMQAFMETLVFAALFANIFVLLKRMVVRNIRKVNGSLAQITQGNLDVTVDVRDNEEFASLSDDINATVSTLKHYIDEAAARFDKDLEIAKQIQKSSLPSVFPPYPGRKDFSIYATMDAAKEVGGDFYDFYLLDENHLAFVVADVSGKGIPGAMFMMTAKTLIKSYAESGLPVDRVFTQVNAELCENNEAGMFVTAWMGVLDLESGMISYANAGHNPPLVKRKDGTYEYLKGRANFVLAGMEGVRYKRQQLQLQQGDELYLYTDGVTEAHDTHKQLFGEERLLAGLNETAGLSVEDICRKIKNDVDTFVGEAEQFDDITMMCVRLNEVEEKMLAIVPTMESVPEAAAFVEKQLEFFEVPAKLTMRLLVAMDEIYSNIVRYSGATEAQIRIVREADSLRLIFRDNGKPYNPLDNKDPDITASAEDRSIGGLGIFMVRKMMSNVEYEYTQNMNKLTLTMNL